MLIKIEELTEEQALEIGRKLAESIENEGFVEYYDSFKFGNDLEVIRMNDIEAYSFLTDYLDSIGSSLEEWIAENAFELYQNNRCGYGIYSRDAINDLISKDNEDFADYAELENVINKLV
jgi:hypothetical protein